jgi:hypothetical protein
VDADHAAAVIKECALETTGNVPAVRITPPAPANYASDTRT